MQRHDEATLYLRHVPAGLGLVICEQHPYSLILVVHVLEMIIIRIIITEIHLFQIIIMIIIIIIILIIITS